MYFIKELYLSCLLIKFLSALTLISVSPFNSLAISSADKTHFDTGFL